MTEREALKMALEWFCCYLDKSMSRNNQETLAEEAITAIKEALAQPEQEPVAAVNDWSNWRDMVVVNIMRHGDINKHLARKLANHFQKAIPQRKPLTDEEIQYAFKTNSVMVDDGNAYMVAGKRAINIARAIEAKLKEKNNV